jgi:hypothetical protein
MKSTQSSRRVPACNSCLHTIPRTTRAPGALSLRRADLDIQPESVPEATASAADIASTVTAHRTARTSTRTSRTRPAHAVTLPRPAGPPTSHRLPAPDADASAAHSPASDSFVMTGNASRHYKKCISKFVSRPRRSQPQGPVSRRSRVTSSRRAAGGRCVPVRCPVVPGGNGSPGLRFADQALDAEVTVRRLRR